MAVRKATRSKSAAQPQPQPTRSDTPNQASMSDPQLKAQLVGTLAHLNRGFGIALSALDRLRKQNRRLRPGAFPLTCLNDFRCQTETLQASANRDLLRLMATREEKEAERLNLLCRQRRQSQEPSRPGRS
jgi:hypothetical protein